DALFVEVHEEPSRAPSDGTNMLRLGLLGKLLEQLLSIRDSGACAQADTFTTLPA
ncbi:MAG: 3-deoxy-8-phosphooctulonate synthase, partial [Deltaproteobacteria bacterium]